MITRRFRRFPRAANGLVACAALASIIAATQAQPSPPPWTVASDFRIELVGTGYRLPVNIAFVPNPDPGPEAPLYYVAELYGSIQVVKRNGVKSIFATGLLDYNPLGPIAGTGEQGLTGIVVERDSVNPTVYHLYVTMLWNNGAPPGGSNHYPKVERIDSAPGGLTMISRTVLLNMQPEFQGQSHQISNITIGPDNKLYVHMGDAFIPATALNLEMYRGKILRMNKDGTAVATGDPAGANPFYNAVNGITARDYVYTYGHANPFGGAWRLSNARHYVVENGNAIDRMVALTPGTSYGWAGNDSVIVAFSLHFWNPAVVPVNIAILQAGVHANSSFPAAYNNRAYVTLAGPTYAMGPGIFNRKCITEFSDLDTVDPAGHLTVPPRIIAQYSGTGRASVAALAAGPDGLYFSDLYEDTGAIGPTAIGANIYRLRYRCPADLPPGNGVVDVNDLLAVISTWGPCAGCPPVHCLADIAPLGPPPGDCQINVNDLLAVITTWGACP